MTLFNELFKYREFLFTSVKKEFRGKYKKSFLGVLWSFLNPLCQVLIYAVVFPFILGNKIDNYVVYLIIGLMPWTFFSGTIIQSAACVVANAGIVKKVYFPREILPISVATSNLINFFITQIIVLASLFISGVGIGKSIVVFPVVVIIQYILQLGLAFIFSAITVFVRDVEYLITIFIQLMFYLCPIVYTPASIPSEFIGYFKLNPMFHIISFYRTILYEKSFPNFCDIGKVTIMCLSVLFIGYFIFNKVQKGFAEEL